MNQERNSTYSFVKLRGEFKGKGNVSYRIDILQETPTESKVVTLSSDPFILEYPITGKIEPIRSSGATMTFISRKAFEFCEMHTDQMQKFLVKFYRDGNLEWLGWLAPETYQEDFNQSENYPIEFTASDFNICDRLKYLKSNGERFTEIQSHKKIIQNCLDILKLPFGEPIYKCSTTYKDKTHIFHPALTYSHQQNGNFYDEDGEAMSVREVLESVLQPYGLIMTQKGGNLYIYDYSAIIDDPSFATRTIDSIGYSGNSGNLEYEEMVNGVELNCSMYAEIKKLFEDDIELDRINLSTGAQIGAQGDCVKYKWDKSQKHNYSHYTNKWEIVSDRADIYALIFNDSRYKKTDGGLRFPYEVKSGAVATDSETKVIFKAKLGDSRLLAQDNPNYKLRIRLPIKLNTKGNNIFGDGGADEKTRNNIVLRCNLYCLTTDGRKHYFDTSQGPGQERWITISQNESIAQGRFRLFYCHANSKTKVVDEWMTNNNTSYLDIPGNKHDKQYPDYAVGKGYEVFFKSKICGELHFEVCNICSVFGWDYQDKCGDNVINDILIKGLELSFTDINDDSANVDDIVYKSFINKNVASDYDDIDLKCISCNKEEVPFGLGNIINVDGEILHNYTRKGVSAELEKLLLRTIHSNHKSKNYKIDVPLNTSENLSLTPLVNPTVLPDELFYQSGTLIDYVNGTQEISLHQIREDHMSINEIPIEQE